MFPQGPGQCFQHIYISPVVAFFVDRGFENKGFARELGMAEDPAERLGPGWHDLYLVLGADASSTHAWLEAITWEPTK